MNPATIDKSVKIAVVGSGYVGLIAAVCFAELGHQVVCVDIDRHRVEQLNAGEVPIYEELLPELLARHRGRGLSFTTDLTEAAKQSEAIFIAVGTPQSPTGEADLSQVEASVSEIAAALGEYKMIVEKSTVPVLTNRWIRRTLLANGAREEHFDVISNPEFLREGTAVEDFLYPDRVVIGADQARARELARRIYQPMIDGSYYRREDRVPGARELNDGVLYLETSAQSAELIKHASNAFLAMKISFINAVSNLCELVGSDVTEVARGIGSDARIGQRFLNAGIGYGGSCFPKDVRAFYKVAESVGYDFELLQVVERINTAQQQHFMKKLRGALWNLRGKKVGVLGLAFKGGTDDVRESPAIQIVRTLLAEGCQVAVYDPAAMEKARRLLPNEPELTFAADSYRAAEGAHALLVVTEWKEFVELDLRLLRGMMRYPVVIDGRNLFSLEDMERAGFQYHSVGRATVDGTRIESGGVRMR